MKVKISWLCIAGTGQHFHQQWQWLFLVDASVAEPCDGPKQTWMLAVKYKFDGTQTMPCNVK